MGDRPRETLEASPEQIRYAAILEKGMFIGLIILLVTFLIYAAGIVKPYIPKVHISHYWTMNVHEYLHETHIGTGWSWLGMLNYGDFLNFVGIAILAGVTVLCYLAIIPIFLKNHDRIYAVFALLEALILSLAASGILAVGH